MHFQFPAIRHLNLFADHPFHHRQFVVFRAGQGNADFGFFIDVPALSEQAVFRPMNARAVCPHQNDGGVDSKTIGCLIETPDITGVFWKITQFNLRLRHIGGSEVENALRQINFHHHASGNGCRFDARLAEPLVSPEPGQGTGCARHQCKGDKNNQPFWVFHDDSFTSGFHRLSIQFPTQNTPINAGR